MSNKRLKTQLSFPSPEFNDTLIPNLSKLAGLYKQTSKYNKLEEKKFNFEIYNEPFKCCIISNFLDDNGFVNSLKNELLNKANFKSKSNDLYNFKQTKDLQKVDLNLSKIISSWFKTEVLQLIKNITSLKLFDDAIDITASKYEYTNTLLCHDDMLDERRIAFIYYLVDENWEESDGGHLDLFKRDENNQPTTCEVSLIPKLNNLIFFEVTPYSYHQVREVLSKNKVRLTINGWFKGQNVHEENEFSENFICPIRYNDFFVEETLLKNFLNSFYLSDEIQTEIRKEFKSNSETMLVNILKPDKFSEIEEELKNCTNWKLKLPANRRKYYYLEPENYPPLTNDLIKVFKSEPMFLIFSCLTSLKLHHLSLSVKHSDSDSESDDDDNKTFNPRCLIELRKWEKSCYSLIHDHDGEILDKSSKLDVKLYFNHNFKANPNKGGCTHYLEKNEDYEILTVEPINNALSLVFRDEHTVRFEKYLNDSHEGTFYELSMIFQE